jgi:flagellar biosynthesis/type III secretory pathway M-ring protein FliF/YscJ
MDNAGNISVPSDKIGFVRTRLAMSGKLPKSTHPGYEGLTTMGMMNTPKVEEERLKTMLEGELAKEVEMFDGVDSAGVHLTFGIDSPFATEKKDAQASVTVSEKGAGSVNASEGRAIATLVASSVPGMDSKRVTIFSRDGRAVFDGSTSDEASGQALTKLDLEKKEAENRRTELQQTLNQVVGPGNAIVTVNLTVDDKQEREDSNVPVMEKLPSEEEKLTEKMTGPGTPPVSNPDPTKGPAAPGEVGKDGGYSNTNVRVARATGFTERHIVMGVGSVKSMAVTVFLNKAKADPANPDADTQSVEREEAVRRAVNTFLGLTKQDTTGTIPPLSKPMLFTPKDGFTSEIISYPFDDKVAKDSEKAVTDQAGQQKMSQIMSIIPAVILAILAFIVMGKLSKLAKPAGNLALAGAGSGGYGSLSVGQGTYPMGGVQALPPNPVQEELRQRALSAGITEEELNSAMAAATAQGVNLEDIPSIGKRINLPLEQIRKMGDERPEVVAMLVKSWLLEDRK